MNKASLSPEQNNLRNIILIALSALLFIYVFLRAYFLSFTTDENGTFTMFLQKGIIIPQHYDVYAANDHILNTALMMISAKLFGIGELALRLPNVLFYILFLWSTAKIVCRFNNVLFSIGAFLLLNFHPYVIQYFSLARGYGIAMACSMAAILYLWKYLEDGARVKDLMFTVIFSALMVFANFTFMNLWLPINGFLFILILWQPYSQAEKKTRTKHAIIFVMCSAIVFFSSLHILLQMKEANALFAGTKDLFWDISVRGLFLADLMDAPYTNQLLDGILLAVEVLFAAAAVVILFFVARSFLRRKKNIFPLMIFGILFAAWLSVYVQHMVFGTPYPALRMALYFIVPFFLMIIIAMDLIPGKKNYAALFQFMLGVIFVTHTIRTASFYHSFGWNYGEDNRSVAEILMKQHAADPSGRIRMSYNGEFSYLGFDYYRIKNNMSWLDLFHDSIYTGDPMNDLAYVTPEWRKCVPDSAWEIVKEFRSGNVLMKPKISYHALPGVVHMGINVLGKKDPNEIILNFAHPSGGFISAFKDTIPGAERFLCTGTLDVKQSEKSHGALYLVIEHDHKQYYVNTWDLSVWPANTERFETITISAAVPSSIADGDMISFYAGYLDGEPFEVNNIKIDLTPFTK